MVGEKTVRTMLAPAGPARYPVAPPQLSAQELISRAESSAASEAAGRVPRPTRRLVLAAGAVVVAGGAAGIVYRTRRSAVDTPALPPVDGTAVLVPVAYQYQSDPAPAGPYLRELAGKLVDAGYEKHTGKYAYHRTRLWGDPVLTSPDGPYILAYASETQLWEADDGTGRQSTMELPPQYPDQASENYWRRNMKDSGGSEPAHSFPLLPPEEIPPLPTDAATLRHQLDVAEGPAGIQKGLGTLYGRYVVPRQIRADILTLLAEVPGYVWRGSVVDRAGRAGVAITAEDEEFTQLLLIFHPATGELLGSEFLLPQARRLTFYELFLETDRVATPGA